MDKDTRVKENTVGRSATEMDGAILSAWSFPRKRGR